MRGLLSNYKHVVVLLKNCLRDPQFGSVNYIGKKSQESREQFLRGRQLLG